MKFLAGATLGYFSLKGLDAIDGMHRSMGGPIPTRFCGTLEDHLTVGDFPANTNYARFFVRYNRQNRDIFRGFVKCAPFDQQDMTVADARARKRFAAFYQRNLRMGLWRCDRVNRDDGWVKKWDIPAHGCPAREAGSFLKFFPKTSDSVYPQPQTETEDPYYPPECMADMNYWRDGAWSTADDASCSTPSFAPKSDGTCIDLADSGFITVDGDYMDWEDTATGADAIYGIPCGFQFSDIELTHAKKLRSVTFSNADNKNHYLHNTMFKGLKDLATIVISGQEELTDLHPDLLKLIRRPRKLKEFEISGMRLNVMRQMREDFFGYDDWVGRLDSFTMSDNSHLTALKEGWFEGIKNIDLHASIFDNGNLVSVPTVFMERVADVSTLDLSGNNLASLPDVFGNMTNVEEIDLSDNNFDTVPNEYFAGMSPDQAFEIELDGNNCTPSVSPCTSANVCECD